METSKKTRILSIGAAILFALGAMFAAYRSIGLAPVVIVGGSSLVGMAIWIRTYLRRPVDPRVILPPFLLTVAALEVHMAEEYLTGFGPAMSRLFDVSWTEQSFVVVFTCIGPAIYALTALGLYYRVPIAGFVAWFIFIGPGLAELTHFVFPVLEPAILSGVKEPISQTVSNGRFVEDMRNYWVGATGRYYFPGMYTAVLPMIPGIWAIVTTFRRRVGASAGSAARASAGASASASA